MPKKRVKKKKQSATIKNNKFKYALKSLIFFGILSLLFAGFSSYSGEEFYSNLFLIISIISGAVSLSFLVSMVVLFFVKIMKKK